MGYMTFEQQVASHLQFLQNAGIEITDLKINPIDFIRSHAEGEIGRGEYAYKTISRQLEEWSATIKPMVKAIAR
jgi:hypothetical protein